MDIVIGGVGERESEREKPRALGRDRDWGWAEGVAVEGCRNCDSIWLPVILILRTLLARCSRRSIRCNLYKMAALFGLPPHAPMVPYDANVHKKRLSVFNFWERGRYGKKYAQSLANFTCWWYKSGSTFRDQELQFTIRIYVIIWRGCSEKLPYLFQNLEVCKIIHETKFRWIREKKWRHLSMAVSVG